MSDDPFPEGIRTGTDDERAAKIDEELLLTQIAVCGYATLREWYYGCLREAHRVHLELPEIEQRAVIERAARELHRRSIPGATPAEHEAGWHAHLSAAEHAIAVILRLGH